MNFPIGRTVVRVQPALPPLHRQAVNLTKAVVRVGRAVLNGKPIWRTPAKREEWRAICQKNQCGFYRELDQRCAHPDCGCGLERKMKYATERCPVGLFGE